MASATRLKEHKRAVQNSKVAQHANQFGHDIDCDLVTVVEKTRGYHKWLFLEVYFLWDRNAGTEHTNIRNIYTSLA